MKLFKCSTAFFSMERKGSIGVWIVLIVLILALFGASYMLYSYSQDSGDTDTPSSSGGTQSTSQGSKSQTTSAHKSDASQSPLPSSSSPDGGFEEATP
jgi:flagellar basal body-associated protein FliL